MKKSSDELKNEVNIIRADYLIISKLNGIVRGVNDNISNICAWSDIKDRHQAYKIKIEKTYDLKTRKNTKRIT